MDATPIVWKRYSVLTQKIIYPVFSADITLDASFLSEGERTGVCMTGGQYITAYIEKEDGEYLLKVAQSEGNDRDKREVVKNAFPLRHLLSGSNNPEAIEEKGGVHKELTAFLGNLKFQMSFMINDDKADSEILYFRDVNHPYGGNEPNLKIAITLPDGTLKDLGVNYTPSDHTWVGARLGIYAFSGKMTSEHGYADFKSVIVKEL